MCWCEEAAEIEPLLTASCTHRVRFVLEGLCISPRDQLIVHPLCFSKRFNGGIHTHYERQEKNQWKCYGRVSVWIQFTENNLFRRALVLLVRFELQLSFIAYSLPQYRSNEKRCVRYNSKICFCLAFKVLSVIKGANGRKHVLFVAKPVRILSFNLVCFFQFLDIHGNLVDFQERQKKLLLRFFTVENIDWSNNGSMAFWGW